MFNYGNDNKILMFCYAFNNFFYTPILEYLAKDIFETAFSELVYNNWENFQFQTWNYE